MESSLQEVARRIFLDLTQLGERSEDTRRRVKKADLLTSDWQQSVEVLKALTDARLVVTGKAAGETGEEKRQWRLPTRR